MNKNLIIPGVCLLIIGILIALLLRPAPKPVIIGDLTPAQEKDLKASLEVQKTRGDSLQSELDKSKALGKVAEKEFKREITGKLKTIAELKSRPEVIQLVKDNPALDSLHRVYDSTVVAYEIRIFSLTNELEQRDQINLQVKKNFEDRLEDTQRLLQDKELEVADLQHENKKLRRKLTGTKILGGIIILGIGALSIVN